MATVDELIVKIQADTKDLRKKLGETNKQLDKIDRNSKEAGASMSAAFTKGKIAIVAAAAAAVKSATGIARVGMQFEDLKDSLDQVFGSMKAGDAAMKNVFKFAQTTPFQIEDATKAFIALKSAGLEPNMEQLQVFADTASVSVDQLGTFEALIRMVQRSASGGMGLEELNMISDRGIDVLGILGDKLNLTKDDIAKFGKTADGAAKMVAALTEGLQERFGGAMEAKMDNLSTKTSNMTIAFKQLADDVFNSGLGQFLKDIADALNDTATGILNARRAARGEIVESPEEQARRSELTPQQRIDEDVASRKQVTEELTRQINKMQQAEELFGLFGNQRDANEAARAEKEIQKLTTTSIELTQRINSERKGLNTTNKEQVLLTDEQIALQNEFNSLFNDTISEHEKLSVKIKTLSEALQNNTKDAKGNPLFDPEKGEIVLAHLIKLRDELGEVDEFTAEMKQAVISASQAFGQDFVDALLEGESALESFKNFAKSLVSQIITIFMQLAVINPILNQIFNAGLPQMGSGIPMMSDAEAMSIDASLHTGGVHAAGGGSAQRGTPMLVGERGPEIFVPHSAGAIMNNMQSRNAIGGGGAGVTVNQSINFTTGVVPTVRAEVTKMLPQISEVAKAGVLEAGKRGGNFRKGLLGG
tara:strand:+ start:3622 stop:5565 length:1944 start_codon:yes stop_codon:yes gene_type:complete